MLDQIDFARLEAVELPGGQRKDGTEADAKGYLVTQDALGDFITKYTVNANEEVAS